MQATPSLQSVKHTYWPSARQFAEAIQCPAVCFTEPALRKTLPAVDRLGMPLVTSGQFAYVYKLNAANGENDVAVRCFRGYLGDRDQRYRAIQSHLGQNPVASLSDFRYEPEGILVGGTRFPILCMDWIEGPTLDLYLQEMARRKDVLLHLAQEWLKLISSLRQSGIAHGDLQHGNIIVEHGSLRLVDHDGMYVPELNGWVSSEVGHQHYQHPARDPDFFDSSLDNFSAIVIYLTLISLAEAPELWEKYHDENLLFTKSDFLAPDKSSLFTKIRALGEEHLRLADVLADSAAGKPELVPSLLDLVDLKTGLPAWMTAPVNLESQVKTREVAIDPLLLAQHPKWIPWKAKNAASTMPTTPPSSTVQTLFGDSSIAVHFPNITDPTAVWQNTTKLAKEMLGRTFIVWYWGIYFLLQILGVGFLTSFALGILLMALACLIYGFVRAQQLAQEAAKLRSATPTLPIASSPVTRPIPRQTAHRPPVPLSITADAPLIGNTVLSIFHSPDCPWVGQIPQKNRVRFVSSGDAASSGFKPCRICTPSN